MTRKGRRIAVLVGMVVAFAGSGAEAGMRPHPRLTDLGKFRLDVISFFTAAVLGLSLIVMIAWNALASDFRALPRLSYFKSLGVVTLWGLLFIVVLAMISGARELMTPGAWEKREDGGYRLAKAASPAEQFDFARRRQLERLRDALWAYAKAHKGEFPPHDLVGDIPAEAWETVHPTGVSFLYVPGNKADAGNATIAYEPGVYGQMRLALLASGSIESRRLEDIRAEINERGRR